MKILDKIVEDKKNIIPINLIKFLTLVLFIRCFLIVKWTQIYKKESKKGTAIRKFLFWKSNKEKSSDYPSYLCYYLDYSDGRGDPIKRKLYPFEDEKLGLNHFKNLVSENIKKGWEKHGAWINS